MSGDDSTHPNALTRLVERAQSGLRRDVQALLDALPTARLLLPLLRSVPAAPVGQAVVLNQTVDLAPHYLPDGHGRRLLALFTYFGPLDRIVPALKWTTDGAALQLFTLPGPAALRFAYKVVDAWNVMKLVIDPGAPSELFLTRTEVSSLLDGVALPLEAYSAAVREAAAAAPDLDEPLPPGLVRAVATCLSNYPEVRAHRLERLFDPERDVRPRIVLRLWASESTYRVALVDAITAAVQEELPPPGEMQIRFE